MGCILKTANIVDTVKAMIIEIVAIIGPTVNTVNSARRLLLNIVNVAKTLNSRPLYCEILFMITSPLRVPLVSSPVACSPDCDRIPLPFGQNG